MINIAAFESYIGENSVRLFKTHSEDYLNAIFDEKGFHLSMEAQQKYDQVKSTPHIYIAFTKNVYGHYYIGKSYQNGGRWKRQHAYHLGTLAYHILKTIRYDDQNHQHWIDQWMDLNKVQISTSPFSIYLKEAVYIVFLPFELYSETSYTILPKSEIRAINTRTESELINHFKTQGIKLLNIQKNR